MAGIINILNAQNEKLSDLLQKKEHIKTSLENIYESGEELDIMGLTNYKNYLAKLTTEEKNQGFVIETTKKVLLAKQAEVNETYKELKVMEKLKESEEKKYYGHIDYVQSKEIDDIASTRYHRVSA